MALCSSSQQSLGVQKFCRTFLVATTVALAAAVAATIPVQMQRRHQQRRHWRLSSAESTELQASEQHLTIQQQLARSPGSRSGHPDSWSSLQSKATSHCSTPPHNVPLTTHSQPVLVASNLLHQNCCFLHIPIHVFAPRKQRPLRRHRIRAWRKGLIASQCLTICA